MNFVMTCTNLKCYKANDIVDVGHICRPSFIKTYPICENEACTKKGTAHFQEDCEWLKVEPADDPVNHPKHYNSHPSGVECIEITRHMSFNLGNAMKYLWRNGLKDGTPDIEDLEKAIWYIRDEINERSKTR